MKPVNQNVSNDTVQHSLIVLMDYVVSCMIYLPDVKLCQHIIICHPSFMQITVSIITNLHSIKRSGRPLEQPGQLLARWSCVSNCMRAVWFSDSIRSNPYFPGLVTVLSWGSRGGNLQYELHKCVTLFSTRDKQAC